VTGAILVFDSGFGGLTVYSHVADQMPGADMIYCADNAGFPYGDWEEGPLVVRIVALVGRFIDKFNPSAILIACNTATTISIDALRAAYSDAGTGIPIVGTVPAIKVAAEISESRMFSVLATPATVHRDYTRALIAVFAGDCDVTLVGVDQLAAIAEERMRGCAVDVAQLSKLISPAFVEKAGQRTDTVVLGCTHYPLIEAELIAASPWPVRFIDPAPAIARRLHDVLGDVKVDPGDAGRREIVFTAPVDNQAVQPVLDSYGFALQMIFEFPV
jgi:glutamate racemase